jgi:hypothetical protein
MWYDSLAGDRPIALFLTAQVEAQTKRGHISIPCLGFEPTMVVFVWLKTVSGKLIIPNVKTCESAVKRNISVKQKTPLILKIWTRK